MVVAVGGALGLGYGVAGARLRAEEKAWAQAGLSFDDMLRRWPTRGDSAGAVTLDRLARPLGVRLILAEGETQQVDDRPLYDAMTKFMGELSSEDSHCSAVPDAARRFLDTRRPQMAAVVTHLHSDAEIAWRMDLSAGLAAPIPGLLAQRHLNTLLLLEALQQTARGDKAAAEQALEAAWRQGETLAARPDVISLLIAMALAGQQAAVLRCLPDAAPTWDARLTQRPFRAPGIERLRTEAYGFWRLGQDNRGAADVEAIPPFNRSPGALVVRYLTIPWVRLSTASASGHLRRARELQLATDFCRVPGDDLEKAFTAGIPRWDAVSKAGVPSLLRVAASAVAAELEAEMTGHVLRLRRRLRQGELVHGAPFSLPSNTCPGLVWRHTREEDARWSVYAEPAPIIKRKRDWQYTLGTGFPRR